MLNRSIDSDPVLSDLAGPDTRPQSAWLTSHTLPSGTVIHFRDATPADAEAIADAVSSCSSQTLLHRFFSPISFVSLPRLRELLQIDRPTNQCVIGEIQEEQRPRVICGFRLVRENPQATEAEFAVTIHDQFQQQGLGTELMTRVGHQADHLRIQRINGFLLYSNVGMRRLAKRVAPLAKWYFETPMVRVQILTSHLLSSSPTNSSPTNRSTANVLPTTTMPTVDPSTSDLQISEPKTLQPEPNPAEEPDIALREFKPRRRSLATLAAGLLSRSR